MSYVFAEIYDEVYQNYKDYYLLTSKLIKKFAHRKSKILDLGCGTGILEKYLPRNYSIIGIDISREMIKVARKKKLKNVKFYLRRYQAN